MSDGDDILEIIFSSIDALNETLTENQRVEKSLETPLFGPSSKLDSLGIINLIVAVEQKLSMRMGQPVTLANARAMAQKDSPFRTVGSLAEYVRRQFMGASR